MLNKCETTIRSNFGNANIMIYKNCNTIFGKCEKRDGEGKYNLGGVGTFYIYNPIGFV